MKTYIKPIVKIVEVENENILAGSVTTNDVVGNKSVLSKKHSLHGDEWDFDGEEDY